MNTSILKYKGLYGDNQLPFMSDFIHIEGLEVRSKIYEWEISQHIHSDLFQLFIIQKGNGFLISEKKKLTLNSPCLMAIPPNNMHGFTLSEDTVGHVITISDTFLTSLFKEKPHILQEINQLHLLPLEQHPRLLNEIIHIKNNIQQELLDEKTEKLFGLKSYFQILFLLLYRQRQDNDNTTIQSSNKSLLHFQQFQEFIKQSLQNPLTIKAYAKKLNITQMHLNRVCHSVADKSALKIVQDYMINEAKKYLLNTSYSISEIAYFLNFNDPAYFGRLFKKRVGVSPGEFRKG